MASTEHRVGDMSEYAGSYFTVSIKGFPLYKIDQPVEFRRITLLVGPNGAGKSSFINFVPLFSLAETVPFSEIYENSEGDARIYQQIEHGSHLDVVVEYPDSFDRAFRTFIEPITDLRTRFRSILESTPGYGLDSDTDDIQSLVDYQYIDWPEIEERLLERGGLFDHESRGGLDRTTPKQPSNHRTRVEARYYADKDGASFRRCGLTVTQITADDRRKVSYQSRFPVSKDEVVQPVSYLDLQALKEYRVLNDTITELLSFGLPEVLDRRWSDPNSEERNLFDITEERVLGETFTQATGHDVDRGIGRLIARWLVDFFLDPVESFFADIFRAESPIATSTGLIQYKDTETHRGSKIPNFLIPFEGRFAKYQLRRLGIGEDIRVRSLERHGFVVEVLRRGSWQNVFDLGSGLTRLVFLIRALQSIRRTILEWYSPRSFIKTLIILEPEAHLHPRLQSSIADLLVDNHFVGQYMDELKQAEFRPVSKEEGRLHRGIDYDRIENKAEITGPTKFIVETHSEYIVRKLQALVANGQLDRKDIGIVYFSDPGYGGSDSRSRVETTWNIGFNNDGTLTRDFGPGFFGESASLIDDLWSAWRPKS